MRMRGKQFHWWFGLLNWTRVVPLRRRKMGTTKKHGEVALSNWIRSEREREKAEPLYTSFSPSPPGATFNKSI